MKVLHHIWVSPTHRLYQWTGVTRTGIVYSHNSPEPVRGIQRERRPTGWVRTTVRPAGPWQRRDRPQRSEPCGVDKC